MSGWPCTDDFWVGHVLISGGLQWSAQVFKRAGRQSSKRAFSARLSMIKKTLTTVISAFYQHFYDYFCDGHLFDSSLFIFALQ